MSGEKEKRPNRPTWRREGGSPTPPAGLCVFDIGGVCERTRACYPYVRVILSRAPGDFRCCTSALGRRQHTYLQSVAVSFAGWER